MKHRIRSAISQRREAIPETLFQTFIGGMTAVIVVLFLIFFVEPAIRAVLE